MGKEWLDGAGLEIHNLLVREKESFDISHDGHIKRMAALLMKYLTGHLRIDICCFAEPVREVRRRYSSLAVRHYDAHAYRLLAFTLSRDFVLTSGSLWKQERSLARTYVEALFANCNV